MHTPSPPTPPDPQATASAQTGTNLATAQANAAMNNINQVTPYGNLTYAQSGQNFISDPNGQQYYTDGQGHYQTSMPGGGAVTPGTPGTAGHYETRHTGAGGRGGYDEQVWVPGTAATAGSTGVPSGWSSTKGYYVPTYTATQTLSPEQQKILDQTQAAQLNLGTLANQQSAKMVDYLNQPVDLSSENIDKYSNTHYLNGFNNQWDRQQASLDQKLADMGVQLGSEAYSNANRDFTTQKTAANDQFLGDMYDRAQQAILTQRNQPINEIGALLSGSQVTQPTYAGQTSSSAIPTVDYAGLAQQNFANQSQNYQQQLASQNAAMGGLFGLGSAALGGWAKTGFAMSDRRLKSNIERVGTLKSGLPVYEFDYVWGGDRQTGVMADEVEAVMPWAVMEGPGQFKMVDYARVA